MVEKRFCDKAIVLLLQTGLSYVVITVSLQVAVAGVVVEVKHLGFSVSLCSLSNHFVQTV